ncbi:MAG: hypothetical protein AAFV43_12195 [Planctomycetota bacterium]
MADPSSRLLITIDGLRAAAIGVGGATAYDTPELDRFATQSIAFQHCQAETPFAAEVCDRILPRIPGEALLLTDDPGWIDAASTAGLDTALLTAEHATAIADHPAETEIGRTLSLAADAFTQIADGALPPLVWLHVRGLNGAWDAPPETYASLIDEEDPEVEASHRPPDATHDDLQSAEACEARFGAACRYAGQVRVLDACLGGLLDEVAAVTDGAAMPVAVAGLRGFPLGEHGQIGGVDPRLYTEQQHVPLLIHDPSRVAFASNHSPIGLSDAIGSWLDGSKIRPADPCILQRSPDVGSAIQTPDWRLRAPQHAAPELYVKPDDRWDHNDVAKLCEDTVLSLLSRLQAEPPADQNDVGRGGASS